MLTPPARTARPEENPRKPAKPLPGQLDLLAGLTARNAAVTEAIAQITPKPAAVPPPPAPAYVAPPVPAGRPAHGASPKLDARLHAMTHALRRAEEIGQQMGVPFDAQPSMTQFPTGPGVVLRVTEFRWSRKPSSFTPKLLEPAYLQARLRGQSLDGIEPMTAEWRAVTGAVTKALREERFEIDGKPARVLFEITPAALTARAKHETPRALAAGEIMPSDAAAYADLRERLGRFLGTWIFDSAPRADNPTGRILVDATGATILLAAWPRTKKEPSLFGVDAREALKKGGAIYEGDPYVIAPGVQRELDALRAAFTMNYEPRITAVTGPVAYPVTVAFAPEAMIAEAKRLGGSYLPKRR